MIEWLEKNKSPYRLASLLVNLIAYTDDLTLVAASGEGMEEVMKKVNDFCTHNNITINENKSSYHWLRGEPGDIKTRGTDIRKEGANGLFTILGWTTNLKMNWDKQIELLIQRFMSITNRALAEKKLTLNQKVEDWIHTLIKLTQSLYSKATAKYFGYLLDKTMNNPAVNINIRIAKAIEVEMTAKQFGLTVSTDTKTEKALKRYGILYIEQLIRDSKKYNKWTFQLQKAIRKIVQFESHNTRIESPEHLEICTDGSLYKGIASYGEHKRSITQNCMKSYVQLHTQWGDPKKSSKRDTYFCLGDVGSLNQLGGVDPLLLRRVQSYQLASNGLVAPNGVN
ncbi:hypothetical protein PROFUN_07763 [Planoprotostelium fungivorum]|uniref:Reverse transcriptase domain-containing protein n=1 Tax=Planoprotostelium fungivorum TaxID=1890364 RepID=A0A2P6N1K4_9EUKA|nr:hypothetical protein PROFUN_07763 [Planoprotostelium fungivorum]